MSHSILIDNKCFQSIFHTDAFLDQLGYKNTPNPSYQKRLSRFIGLLKDSGSNIVPDNEITINSISKENLSKVSCLITVTRAKPYETDELEAISDFILDEKNSILILSNHAPHQIHDNELTMKFGVSVIGGYWGGQQV